MELGGSRESCITVFRISAGHASDLAISGGTVWMWRNRSMEKQKRSSQLVSNHYACTVLKKKCVVPDVGDGPSRDTDFCCTSSGFSFLKPVVGKALIKQGTTQQPKQHANQGSDSIVESCFPQIIGTVVEKVRQLAYKQVVSFVFSTKDAVVADKIVKEHKSKMYTRRERAMIQKQEKDRRHRDSLLMERRGL